MTDSTELWTKDDTGPVIRPDEPRWPKIIRWIAVIVIIGPLIWGLLGLEISADNLRRAPGQMWNLVQQVWPPDFSETGRTFEKILESLYVAWIATIIGATLSFPLGFLAATNIAPRSVTLPVRSLLSGIRAFPELVLAIMLIPAFGLGPFPGALAIGIHSIGTLGKLTSEVIEGVDEGPIEAIRASGGTRMQAMQFGVVPQAMPNVLAYWLYRFEINIRASAVLGVIGAGGIGDEIYSRFLFVPDRSKGFAALLVMIATVLVIDAISASVRRRIITGQPSRSMVARLMQRLFAKKRPAETSS
ncbi:MAG: phosphonate ABC transporter, permease protein PhnE [Acidimicrobiia bacterium]|nr:phosphonate ABC transporter, permease protein PhnE [Acidimicrobiia bacterium]